jgi:hypothetical protein
MFNFFVVPVVPSTVREIEKLLSMIRQVHVSIGIGMVTVCTNLIKVKVKQSHNRL